VKEREKKDVCIYCGNKEELTLEHILPRSRNGPDSPDNAVWVCKKCKKWSTDRGGFEKMKHQALTIVSALDLYFRGISLRQVTQHLQSTFGIDVSYGTIYNWIRKYVELVHDYTKGLKAITSERWNADETLIRVRGRQMVMWSLLDFETRHLIALHISRKRSQEEAIMLFRKGKRASKTSPTEIVTDGLPSYSDAIEAEFGAKNCVPRSEQKVLHILGPLVGKINNNRVERFHGSVKGRLKAMGHLNSVEGAKTFAEGYQIHYNFIREHKALNGKTPAEMTNVSEEKMNWQKLIEKASG